MPRQLSLALAALALLASGAAGQQTRRPVTVVEILGLHRWTPRMVEDSVARYQPGVTLADHACAVILRDSVGFADAAVVTYSTPDTTWAVLSVVEPELKDRVRFRTYSVRRPPPESWAELRDVLEKHPAAMSALQDPGVLLGNAQSFYGRPLPAGADELRRRLRRHRSPADWALARATILADSSFDNGSWPLSCSAISPSATRRTTCSPKA